MCDTNFGTLFRSPNFPVIGFADNVLFSALELSGLVSILVRFDSKADSDDVKVIDASGEEFWYSREQCVLAPGFTFKRWTKRQIIDLYNNNAGNNNAYSIRSLSNKRLSVIVKDIADLILG